MKPNNDISSVNDRIRSCRSLEVSNATVTKAVDERIRGNSLRKQKNYDEKRKISIYKPYLT